MDEKVTSRPWCDLPIELVEFFVSKLSLVCHLRIPAVCKKWSIITNAIQAAKVWPWLMHSPTANGSGICKFFDPLDGKDYTLEIEALLSKERQTFRFSKDGWVIILEGDDFLFMLNPFMQEVVNLPMLDDSYNFNGISFSLLPTSQDCIVFELLALSIMELGFMYTSGATKRKSGMICIMTVIIHFS